LQPNRKRTAADSSSEDGESLQDWTSLGSPSNAKLKPERQIGLDVSASELFARRISTAALLFKYLLSLDSIVDPYRRLKFLRYASRTTRASEPAVTTR
jgi:hypothetical protein